MPPLVDARARGAIWRRCPGLVLNRARRRGRRPATRRRARDLDDLPMPARHLIARVRRPTTTSTSASRWRCMETARGCPVQVQLLLGLEVPRVAPSARSRPSGWCAELRADRGAERLHHRRHLLDERASAARSWRKQIKASGIRKYFTVQTRTDIICKFPHLIEHVEGLRPTGDLPRPRVDRRRGARRRSTRRTPPPTTTAPSRSCKDLGVGYTPNFIVDPAGTARTSTACATGSTTTGAYNSGFSVLTPLPGTDLWDDVKQRRHDRTTGRCTTSSTPCCPPSSRSTSSTREYARLWQHALDVRYQHKGRMKSWLGSDGARSPPAR